MTQSIETLAREIVAKSHSEVQRDYIMSGAYDRTPAFKCALAGINLGREQAAEVARRYRDDAGGSESYRRACEHIAQAIRALP